jgi:hypothetical protein
VINAASKILINIFLPGLDAVLRDDASGYGFAISPLGVLDGAALSNCARIEISMGAAAGEHGIVAEFRNFNDDTLNSIARYAETLPAVMRLRAGMILKQKLQVYAAFHGQGSDLLSPVPGRFAGISIIGPGESSVRIYFRFSILELISRELCGAQDGESLEKAMIDHFREPTRLFPGLGMMMELFDDRELQELFYQLIKNGLLTTYQLCLVVTAFPEHALRVKRCLSANTVRDVAGMMRSLGKQGAITRRDLAEGVYSVEEAVYGLMKRGADLRYASFLREHQSMVSALENMESVLRIDFSAWLERMQEDSLLYHTLARAGEREIARAFSPGSEQYRFLLEKNISARRASGILELAKGACTHEERLSAQCRLVSIYRGLRVRRRNWGSESFEHLLRCMTHPSAFRRLLLETGWFTLSTALKGAKPSVVKKVTGYLPGPACFLIEDVLRGVINPDILHNELQVDEARRRCVAAILSLEEEGVIDLER